jgi:hypothetical protein
MRKLSWDGALGDIEFRVRWVKSLFYGPSERHWAGQRESLVKLNHLFLDFWALESKLEATAEQRCPSAVPRSSTNSVGSLNFPSTHSPIKTQTFKYSFFILLKQCQWTLSRAINSSATIDFVNFILRNSLEVSIEYEKSEERLGKAADFVAKILTKPGNWSEFTIL